MSGVQAAYYLIHSMTAGEGFAKRDIVAAHNFASAARNAGVNRIIYLGALGDPKAMLSEHLRSRQRTGQVLRETGVTVTEFRAAIIVGAGSVSFEMIRYLTERLPIMVCPRWVFSRVQPIWIEDVVAYLVAALETGQSTGEIIEIGGADVLTYGDMMKAYARVRSLHRWLLPVPVLTPRLSSYWVHWVTPISAAFARPLIEGLRNEVIVREHKASEIFPDIKPRDYESSVRRVLKEPPSDCFENIVSDDFRPERPHACLFQVENHQGMIIERWQTAVEAPPKAIHSVFSELAGRSERVCLNRARRVRAAIEKLLRGTGPRRDPGGMDELHTGQIVHFFEVEDVKPERLIRLRAETRSLGKARLQIQTQSVGPDRTKLTLAVFCAPRGLWGLFYWYLSCFPRRWMFSRLIKEAGLAAKTVK